MTRGITLFAALCFCLMLVGSPAVAQEGMPDMTPEQMQAMQAWMEAGTPGEHHEWIAQFEGKWETSTKSWWEPGGDAMMAEGTSETKMIWDNRYAHINSKSQWMDMTSMGQGFMGYDNINEEYFAFWIDNMSTGMFTARGQREGDKLVCHGTMDDPATGEMDKPARLEWELMGPDKAIFRIYDYAGTDKEFLMMEETSTRIKE